MLRSAARSTSAFAPLDRALPVRRRAHRRNPASDLRPSDRSNRGCRRFDRLEAMFVVTLEIGLRPGEPQRRRRCRRCWGPNSTGDRCRWSAASEDLGTAADDIDRLGEVCGSPQTRSARTCVAVAECLDQCGVSPTRGAGLVDAAAADKHGRVEQMLSAVPRRGVVSDRRPMMEERELLGQRSFGRSALRSRSQSSLTRPETLTTTSTHNTSLHKMH